MSGAATEGIETLPDGHAEFHHMSMEYMADGVNPTGVAFDVFPLVRMIAVGK